MTNTAASNDDLRAMLAFGRADRLAKAMRVRGLTNDDMAEALGVSSNTIGNYTSGRTTRISKLAMKEWAVRTGVPLQWLETGVFPDDRPEAQKKAPTPKGGGQSYTPRDSNPEPTDYGLATVTELRPAVDEQRADTGALAVVTPLRA